jgi:hypothetical protein
VKLSPQEKLHLIEAIGDPLERERALWDAELKQAHQWAGASAFFVARARYRKKYHRDPPEAAA